MGFGARDGTCYAAAAATRPRRRKQSTGLFSSANCVCSLLFKSRPDYTAKQKEPPLRLFLFWCERRDLNPYGITTRPSNVRVCRFRHSRIFSSPFLTTNDIISKSRGSVNTFLENILFFSEKNYIVDFRHIDIESCSRAFRYINRKCNVRFNRNVGNLCAFKYFVGILCGGVA